MAIIPSHKNPINILRNFKQEFENRTAITNFDTDSKVRAISDVLTDELLSIREEQVLSYYANQISSARGKSLDKIGESLGLPRYRETKAYSGRSERSFAFYVESGNFGAINAGSPITIPDGTIVRSLPNHNELGTRIEYQTIGNIVLPAADSIGFVTVEAVNSGRASNIGRLTIKNHNFTNYVDAVSNSLKITNFYPVLNGRDTEDDEIYRYRLTQHYVRMLQNNEAKIRLLSLGVPGVLNPRVEAGFYGIGTAAVICMGPEFQTSPSIVQAVQDRLNAFRSPGLSYIAAPAIEAQFDFELEIQPQREITLAQQTRLKSDINRTLLNYFRRIPLGGVVNLTDILTDIQTASRRVIAFKLNQNGVKTFKKVYVRRSLSGTASVERERLIGNIFSLQPQEFASLGSLVIDFVQS